MTATLPPFLTEGPADSVLCAARKQILLADAAEAAESLIAIFQPPTFEAIYLNEGGKRWLNPGKQAKLIAFTLTDIIGIGYLDQLHNEMLPRSQVLGVWSGECSLRDVWGSETPAKVALMFHPAPGDGGRPTFCLVASAVAVPSATHGAYDRELLHALLESVPDAVYFKDLHSRFLRVSRALAHKDGIAEPATLIGKTDFDRFTTEHAEPAYAMEQKIIETGEPVLDLEERETWPDGRVTWVSTSKFPLRDSEGRIVGTFGISRDITASKLAEAENLELQAKVQLNQKLESIGRLAAGIAHEINTPTQYITDNARFVAGAFRQMAAVIKAYRRLRDAAAMHPELKSVVQAVVESETDNELDYVLGEVPATIEQSLDGLGRIARIVCSLKEFSHPNSSRHDAADLNRAIETAIIVSRHEWKYVAQVVTDFDATLPAVKCVLDEFNQVMLNLIINAAHAIATAIKQRGTERGTITVRTRHTEQHVIIEVEDDGTGIAPEHRSRIFEPFFTTKEVGKGTGQGLSIVHAVIVKHHGGSIDFTTEVGRGTTFRLQLPLSPATDAAPAG